MANGEPPDHLPAACEIPKRESEAALSSRLPLTLACADMEIIRPLKEGVVRPDGIDLTVVTDMDSIERHSRFLQKHEFDVAEISLSSFMIARDHGFPAAAIPVFMSRRFGHGFMYVNASKGIRTPADLIGRKVGVKQLQFTVNVLIRGILQHEYGVPQTSMEWFAELDEIMEFAPPPGMKVNRLGSGQSVEAMLAAGELDAVFHPDRIEPIRKKDPRVAQLFPNFKEEEIAYFRKTGMFPIMHLMAIRQEIVESHPWAAANLFNAFNEAKRIAMKRMESPRQVPLVWYRAAWEEQEEIVGADPWEYGGTERNVKNVNTIAGYAHEQGLTKQKYTFKDLFPGF
jgi:4,5-dihydroxyphthalate decarboxylase